MRIFFNRGYSLAPISAAMMQAVPTLRTFIAIGQGKPHYPGATQTLEEPEGDDAHYLAWLREKLEANQIDLLIPTKRRALIAEASASLPCPITLPATLPVLELLEDKAAFANLLKSEDYHLPTKAIFSSAALERALASNDFAAPCIKPRNGVNGLGFWKLNPKASAAAHIDDSAQREIRPDQLLAVLRAQEADGIQPDLVMMDYLPGPEISFDILAVHGEVIKYAARTKISGGEQRIQSHHPLEEAVRSLVAKFRLHGVVNCQFRRAMDGDWKILEINARPAGGSTISEQVGAGVLGDWARLLSGTKPTEIARPRVDTKLARRSFLEEVRLQEAA